MSQSEVLEIELNEYSSCKFASSIDENIELAEIKILKLNETIDSIRDLKPECDKIDYALAACSGALCGVIDIFLVGKPGESPIGNLTDKWFENRMLDFSKLCGWGGDGDKASALRHLEKKFKIPYDQTGMGDAAKEVFNMNAKNHHFKSLGHNPTIAGLFFSILDQFTSSSHFISGGELIALQKMDDGFELQGKDIPGKLFCGFVNWFGHLVSDVSGSSKSKGRGMGLPSPFWAWINDVIAIKAKINEKFRVENSKLAANINEFAVKIYEQGFDLRFQTAQLIPVFVNELIVRFMYSIRRMIGYFSLESKENRSFKLLWKSCEPFSNPTVKRMLAVAHGTFCLIDIGDATGRAFITGGGTFNPTEFFLRLNLAGVGRFTISLYGEAKQAIEYNKKAIELRETEREKTILENYICGLKELAKICDDGMLLTFVEDLKSSDAYINAFDKTVKLAELRQVPNANILKNKQDIDNYFSPRGVK